ncbi:MAG: hypothetical protein EHM58_01535 [Ignavibacteriae bacterium]|nr:MAG: hypothetical protein EHM58_01535 [Ignavibacteriota bacterium]
MVLTTNNSNVEEVTEDVNEDLCRDIIDSKPGSTEKKDNQSEDKKLTRKGDADENDFFHFIVHGKKK